MIQNSAQIARWNGAAPVEQLGTELHKAKNVIKAKYDFATQGGAIGTILLSDDQGNPVILPANAIVTRVTVDFYTPFTSGGSATAALKLQNAADMLGATAVASCTGLADGKPQGAAANIVKITAQSQLAIVIATAALTAGAANVFVEYVLSN